ncbi:molecular chaperone GrpE [Alkaliphilus peptidifermentans DSM 18978]|uniref:Protein GrpE n=2 Tax=Alkaliphilus TaxID=114627 RepID=A0A1G5BXJ4_9FIRM|nr:molecular chaperone GrpE [Alkaliphilus peptidifermentans DSM 18978]
MQRLDDNEETIEKSTQENEDEVNDNNEEVNSNLEAMEEEMKSSEGSIDEILDNDNLIDLLKKKEEEAKDYFNRMQRLQADFINYKKRAEKEKSDIYLYANEKMAEDLLIIIDNLERAVEAVGADQKETSLYQGIELVLKQMKETLKKHAIEEIEALNQPFDMNLHHAVTQEESDSESNTVIEVFQKGYTIKNRVLRPAMVKVAK